MDLQLIRHATLRLTYNGHRILVDPYFADKHSRAPLVDVARNPMTDLPMSISDIIDGTELVIVSHLHFDHFDESAQEALPKDWKIICQPGDEVKIASFGFTDVTPLEDYIEWNGIKITRTKGQHGTGAWLERMGSVMGFIVQASDEPRFYWSGDTIWTDDIAAVIDRFQPNVIVTHSSGSEFEDNAPIVMNAEHTIQVCHAIPSAQVVATHMETIDHGTVTREALRLAADEANVPLNQLFIPKDGDTLSFESKRGF